MGTGILVCGLNGVGKSTLGKALAKKMGYYFIDDEDLHFPGTDPLHTYASPRTRGEAEKLLLSEIATHENFIFASVKGDYGKAVLTSIHYAVLIDVPRDIRIQRVKERSYQRFGSRMLPGGDLYEQEERFFDFVTSRAENTVEEWAKTLSCPIIRVDGTRPIAENINLIYSDFMEHILYF